MPVPSSIADLSTTAASNYPSGSDSIGTSLDDYMRSIQAIIKQQDSKGTGITAASTIAIPNDGSYFVVTGNTTIATISDSYNGRTVKLKFSGTPQLTHSSGLILPGSANITMAAGDVVIVTNESTGVWRMVAYQPASGNLTPLAIGVTVQAYDASLASLAGLSLAQGDILVATGADTVARLAKGTASQQIRMNGGATAPEWFTPTAASGLTLGTPVASTSGTSIDFTSIPAGTKRVTVMMAGVSLSGGSSRRFQLGDSGGIETTGYDSVASVTGGASATASSTGFDLYGEGSASYSVSGRIVFDLLNATTNTWVATGQFMATGYTSIMVVSGEKSISAVLDRVRITSVNGTDTFDAGTINISYE